MVSDKNYKYSYRVHREKKEKILCVKLRTNY